MNCPYCNEKMEKGNIRADGRGGLCWLSEGDDIFLFTTKNIKKHNGVALVKPTMFAPVFKESYVCRNCKKVITEYQE